MFYFFEKRCYNIHRKNNGNAEKFKIPKGIENFSTNKKYNNYTYIKDDVMKLEKYNLIIRMFDREQITDDESFRKYEIMINNKYDDLINIRKKLRKQFSSINNEQEKIRIMKKIKEINEELPKLKKEIDLCNEINVESISIKEKIEGLEKENQKERNE